jgi:hypothetical protein
MKVDGLGFGIWGFGAWGLGVWGLGVWGFEFCMGFKIWVFGF